MSWSGGRCKKMGTLWRVFVIILLLTWLGHLPVLCKHNQSDDYFPWLFGPQRNTVSEKNIQGTIQNPGFSVTNLIVLGQEVLTNLRAAEEFLKVGKCTDCTSVRNWIFKTDKVIKYADFNTHNLALHPIGAYHLLRVYFDLVTLAEEYPNQLNLTMNFTVTPNELKRAKFGLLNLIIYGGQPVENMARGIVVGSDGSRYRASKLDFDDILDIADIALAKMRLDTAVDVLQDTLALLRDDEDSSRLAILENKLSTAQKTHDQQVLQSGFLSVAKSMDGQSQIAFTKLDLYGSGDQRVMQSHRLFLKTYQNIMLPFTNLSPISSPVGAKLKEKGISDDILPFLLAYFMDHHIRDLCQGSKSLRNPSLDSQNKCHFFHFGKPEFAMGPLKHELLNQTPLVSVFHDFASNKEVTAMIQDAESNLRPTPLFVQDKIEDNTDLRSSKVRYIHDSDSRVAKQISSRIGRALNFDLRSDFYAAENFQVMNYGIGGNIAGHLDSVGILDETAYERNLKHGGERFNTFMLYLTNVEAGGRTVFPQLGLSIPPERGSALFWFNLDSADRYDTRNFHFGCPVVFGNKWIANKWTKSLSQWKQYPCLTGKQCFTVG